jgi:hypothetical protein
MTIDRLRKRLDNGRVVRLALSVSAPVMLASIWAAAAAVMLQSGPSDTPVRSSWIHRRA